MCDVIVNIQNEEKAKMNVCLGLRWKVRWQLFSVADLSDEASVPGAYVVVHGSLGVQSMVPTSPRKWVFSNQDILKQITLFNIQRLFFMHV